MAAGVASSEGGGISVGVGESTTPYAIYYFGPRARTSGAKEIDAIVAERTVRPLAILRERDVIALPRDVAGVREQWAAAAKVFRYREDQVVWYSLESGRRGVPEGQYSMRKLHRHVFRRMAAEGHLERYSELPTSAEDATEDLEVEDAPKARSRSPMTIISESSSVRSRASVAWAGVPGLSEVESGSTLALSATCAVARAWLPVEGLEESASRLGLDPDDVEAARSLVPPKSSFAPVKVSTPNPNLRAAIVPFFVTEDLLEAQRYFNCRIFGDHWNHVVQKSWLHPPPPLAPPAASEGGGEEAADEDSHAAMRLGPFPRSEVPDHAGHLHFLKRGRDLPMGYRCRNNEELVRAYDALKAEGVESMLLKPSEGASSGVGIIFDVTREVCESHEFPDEGTGASVCSLEECLDLKRGPSGRVLSPVVHFHAGASLGRGWGPEDPDGGLAEQIIYGSATFGGNDCPGSETPATGRSKAAEIASNLNRYFGYQVWGCDLLLDAKGRVLLTDLNTGRYNGGAIPKLCAQLRAPLATRYRSWKTHVPEGITADIFCRRLRKANLLLRNSTSRGVIPLVFPPGGTAQFLMLATNEKGFLELEERWAKSEPQLFGAYHPDDDVSEEETEIIGPFLRPRDPDAVEAATKLIQVVQPSIEAPAEAAREAVSTLLNPERDTTGHGPEDPTTLPTADFSTAQVVAAEATDEVKTSEWPFWN